jgi:hypothetical protein
MPPSPSQQPLSPSPAQTNVATAADYADAMLIARKARTIFAFSLLAILIFQLALFITFRFTPALDKFIVSDAELAMKAAMAPTTLPAGTVAENPKEGEFGRNFLKYLIGLSDFFGLMFSILLSLVLLLLLNIMLIGRLIGISKVTSAFLWSLVVLTSVFPWQAFLNNESLTRTEFKVPGVLYNWNELSQRGAMEDDLRFHEMVMRWARFLAMPLVTIALCFIVLSKSGRGLRMALGESVGSSTSSSKPKKKEKYDEFEDDRNDPINDRNILT